MKNKKKLWIVGLVILVVLIFLYFFYTNNYKTIKTGNTIGKSAEEIKDYILNISSYEATIELTVNSNKNKNQYIIKQQYSDNGNVFKQEVLEPENIKGLTTSYDGQNLKIENTSLGLSSLYENYKFIAQNDLFLNSFIQEYKTAKDTQCNQNGNQIILTVKNDKTVKTLYFDTENAKPIKMEIQSIQQKTSAYIQYKEIQINNTKREEIIAFNMKLNKYNI